MDVVIWIKIMNCSIIKKVVVRFEIETPKNISIDECSRSKVYSFKCNDIYTTNSKNFSRSQSKHIKFEEYKKIYMQKNIKKNLICIF